MLFKRHFNYFVAFSFAAALLCGGAQIAKAQDLWKDPGTGLIWTVKDSGSDMNSGQAREYCAALKLGGFSDWRLPTLDELSPLYEKGSSKQFKIKEPLQLGDSCAMTSSSNSSGEVWSFCFSYGGQSLRAPSGHGSAGRVLCVRQ
jgi:hypothetical protein